jgi:hypothetical protein
MPRKKDNFSKLSIPIASLTSDAENCYLVYKSPTEFIKINADTAFLAIELSGVKSPYRVIKQINMNNIILQDGELIKKIKDSVQEIDSSSEKSN